MRKRTPGKSSFRFSVAFMLFLIISLIMVATVLVYEVVIQIVSSDLVIALIMVGVIFLFASLCTFIDSLRRRVMIDRPVSDILNAADRIAGGDFSVRLNIDREYDKYTEYDLICENLNIVAEELGKSEVLKSDFISNVSHEIKTPLSVIQNYAMILQDKNLDEQTRRGCAETILAAAKRLSSLVTNILKLNKLENQKIKLEYERVNLTELLEEAVITFEEQIEKKELSINCDLEDVSIISSSVSLEIVFNNLISNAIKFSDKGGEIGIFLRAEGDGAVVRISDKGCGISPEVGSRIFEKFYQADSSRAAEGNGLGLALVKRVIDTLGGEISVSSELGEGSEFTIKLRGHIDE